MQHSKLQNDSYFLSYNKNKLMKKTFILLMCLIGILSSCSQDDSLLMDNDKTFVTTLSEEDRQALPTIQEAWVDAGYFEWRTKENTPSKIWKDGMVALKITELGAKQKHLPDVCDGEQLTSAISMFRMEKYDGDNLVAMGNLYLVEAPHFNTSNITDFSNMFAYCPALTSIPEFDTSKGTNFSGMFNSAVYLTTIPKIDTSKGTDFSYMFSYCEHLTSIPELDTSNSTAFRETFAYCRRLTTIPPLNTSRVTDFFHMFGSCTSLTSIPQLNTSMGIDFSSMFAYCRSLTSIPQLETSKGKDFSHMFYDCKSLETKPNLDLSNASSYGKYDIYTGTPFQ